LFWGETASPERSVGECGGGRISPGTKASENKGLKCGSEKKHPLYVNGYDSAMLAKERVFTKKKPMIE
jgi:hypothetical protein